MLDKFAIFILSHKRPYDVVTIETLRKANYTGDYYIVIDDKDPTLSQYKSLYGDKVIVFSKDEVEGTFDKCDNFPEQSSSVYARNKIFDIAKGMGLEYFLQLDDDYTQFRFRFYDNGKLGYKSITNFNEIITMLVNFLDKDIRIFSVALSQGGDFVGGIESRVFKLGIARKAMNAFFCRTDRVFEFMGTMNEDVNVYVGMAKTGHIFFTIAGISLEQERTQNQNGGISELYNKYGTYVKSFYTVMMNPSCVRISLMGNKDKRIHHKVIWDKCTPKLISEVWKKC